jgi:hypothetical protein
MRAFFKGKGGPDMPKESRVVPWDATAHDAGAHDAGAAERRSDAREIALNHMIGGIGINPNFAYAFITMNLYYGEKEIGPVHQSGLSL